MSSRSYGKRWMKLLVMAVVLGTILPTGLSMCQTIQTTETPGFSESDTPNTLLAVRKVVCGSTTELSFSASKDTPETVKGVRQYNNWRKSLKCAELNNAASQSTSD